jgi:hypothetical protein
MSDHEKTDVQIEAIPWVVGGFVVVMILFFVGVWWIYRFYRSVDASHDERRTYVQQATPIPPEPRLQVDPEVDLQRFRAEQARQLNSYGWAAPEEQRVRIPVERAMELVIQEKQQ